MKNHARFMFIIEKSSEINVFCWKIIWNSYFSSKFIVIIEKSSEIHVFHWKIMWNSCFSRNLIESSDLIYKYELKLRNRCWFLENVIDAAKRVQNVKCRDLFCCREAEICTRTIMFLKYVFSSWTAQGVWLVFFLVRLEN